MKNMISIRVGDRYIDLGKDFTIRLSFSFPFPTKNNIPVASSYWFTFPATDENNITLLHANNVYISERSKTIYAVLIIAGKSFTISMVIKNASNREYKAFVVFNDTVENISSKQLSEVLNERTALGDPNSASICAAAKTMSLYYYPTVKYAFPKIMNETYFADTNADYSANGKIMNDYDSGTGSFKYNYIYLDEIHNRYVLVPMPYLLHVINKIFASIGWTTTGAVMTDIDFRFLIMYNNFNLENKNNNLYLKVNQPAIMPITASITPIVYNKIDFAEEETDESNVYNISTNIYACQYTANYYLSLKAEIAQLDGYLNPPAQMAFYIYNGSTYTLLGSLEPLAHDNYFEWEYFACTLSLVNGTNYSFFVTYDTLNNNARMKNISLEITPKSDGLDRFRNYIDLKDHVPTISVSSFFAEIQKKFAIAVFFNFENKTAGFEFFNHIIDNNSYVDLTDSVKKDSIEIESTQRTFKFITEWDKDELIEGNFKDLSKYTSYTEVLAFADLPTPAIINQICLVKALNKYYVTYADVDGVLFWKEGFDNFYDVDPKVTDSVEIKTLINTLFTRINGANVYPKIKQQGSNAEMGFNDPGFKLLNYHLFYQTNYPFASNSNYWPDGTPTFGIPLQTHGPDGTYERFCKKLYNYLEQNDPVEMDMEIDFDQFFKIMKLFDVGSDTRKIRVGAKNYLPDTADITISLNKIENCKLRLI
jgi:ABC-type uncharacterized transport system substrate-binding protein